VQKIKRVVQASETSKIFASKSVAKFFNAAITVLVPAKFGYLLFKERIDWYGTRKGNI